MMAKIFVSYNIVSSSNCFLVAREKSDPLSEVYRSALLTTPHTQRNTTITPVNPVMHQVEIWSTADNVNLDQLLGTCDIDASISNTVAFGYIQFLVDRGNGDPEYDPASGQGQYVNPDLDGMDYLVFKEGFGPLKWDIDIQTISGGGFEFINGNEFSSGEGYTIQYSLVSTSSSTTSSGLTFPEDVVEVTGNITFSNTHYNKLLEVNSSSGAITITITSLDALPNGTKFIINTHNGSQKAVTLQLNTGRYCLINGNQENAVYLGRAEEVGFIKKGSYLRVERGGEHFKNIGQRYFADGLAPVNGLPETGGWYLKTEYPRMLNWYILRLPSGERINGTEDSTPSASDRTKWIIVATKFWMVDRGGYFDRPIDPDANIDSSARTSGDIQDDAVGPANVNTIAWTGATVGKNFLASDRVGLAATNGDGGVVSSTSASGVNRPNARTITFPLATSGQTRPKNVATNVYRLT